MAIPTRLLITGATGHVGGAVLRVLLRQHMPGMVLAVAARQPAIQAQRLALSRADSVDMVPFDFIRPETVALALRGVTSLLLIRPPELHDVYRYIKPVVAAAVAAGVDHIVYLSAQGAQYNPFAPHHRVEGYLTDSGIRYSLLRPGFFMQNLCTIHRDDIRLRRQLLLPAGHARTTFVDAEDIGIVAANLLITPPALSTAFELTNRQAFTYEEVAAQLSAGLGQAIGYRAISVREFRSSETAKGTPLERINGMVDNYRAARFGLAARISPMLAQLLGREPGTLRAFIKRERACWN